MSKPVFVFSILSACLWGLLAQASSHHGGYSLKLIGTFKPSFYWGAIEPDDKEPREVDLKARDGKVLATVTKGFFKALTMEGTGKLVDRRVINFDTRITNPDGTTEIRWRICPDEAPYGYGKDDRVLLPFRSLAVDPAEIPMDSTIYIPEAKGAVMPDGCCTAPL